MYTLLIGPNGLNSSCISSSSTMSADHPATMLMQPRCFMPFVQQLAGNILHTCRPVCNQLDANSKGIRSRLQRYYIPHTSKPNHAAVSDSSEHTRKSSSLVSSDRLVTRTLFSSRLLFMLSPVSPAARFLRLGGTYPPVFAPAAGRLLMPPGVPSCIQGHLCSGIWFRCETRQLQASKHPQHVWQGAAAANTAGCCAVLDCCTQTALNMTALKPLRATSLQLLD